jgi:NhaP-type Na+/H+ or K+/H+ antiporter
MRGVAHWQQERRSTLAYALFTGGTVFLATMAVGAAAQWLWHRHLDLSTLVGAAVGCTLGVTIMAVWHRVNQQAR